MTYTVTFYALKADGEVIVTVHHVDRSILIAYTGAPAVALAAARGVEGEPKADGFRVVDPEGRVVLNFNGRLGRG